MSQRDVKFIRKNGRVIPVYRSKKDEFVAKSARVGSALANIGSGALGAFALGSRSPKKAAMFAVGAYALDGVGFAGNYISASRRKGSAVDKSLQAGKYAAQDTVLGYVALAGVGLSVPRLRKGFKANVSSAGKKVLGFARKVIR